MVVPYTKCVRLAHSGGIDFSGYDPPIDDPEVVAKTMEGAFKEEPPDISLPQWEDTDGWGGPQPSDPLLLYLRLPALGDPDDGPMWALSLESIVDDCLSFWRGDDDGGEMFPGSVDSAKTLRDALRALADRIDTAIPQSPVPDVAAKLGSPQCD
jgi:hypothetical protein